MVATKAKSSGLVNGRRLRTTRLDACGRPVYGDDSVGVSKGFVSVAYTANTTSADDIDQKNANGESCIFVKGKTTITGYGLEIEFCQVDPALLSQMTGQPVVLSADGTTVVGFDVDTKIDMSDVGVALEVWAGATDSDACATAGAQGSFGYFLVPFLQGGYLGDFTVENGNIDFTWTGANTVDGNGWGFGPYDVVLDGTGTPGPLNKAITSTTALHFEFSQVAPPDPTDGLRPLLDPDTDPITGLAASVVAHVATFTPTPADIVAPFYYEFGDGTWDYITPSAMGATTHTYPESGTYTAKATTDGETWESATVVVA
jgi:hypothetical protein